ncbi:MAG: outer membrane beta-barrel protein [Halioglobus sp.]|nr:outer membrane beta-barrel protein [Caldilineaceae bacterium]MCB1675138.1 outer membrane beta-barrel protein [Halioglobus sp.]
MKKTLILAVSILTAGPIAALAGPASGDKSVTLSGTGSSDKNFDGNTFGVSGEFGYYGSEQLLYGIRQSVAGSVGDEVKDTWNGATRLFADYHFGTGAARPYVGANIGALYGQSVKDTGTAGLEVGLKYYVLDKTFINFGVEYAFLFDDGDDIDNSFDDGAFFYNLGVGFNF